MKHWWQIEVITFTSKEKTDNYFLFKNRYLKFHKVSSFFYQCIHENTNLECDNRFYFHFRSHLSHSIELDISDTRDITSSASRFDLHIKYDYEWWLRTKLYDNRVNILFSVISSPITLEQQKWKSSKMKGILLSSPVSCW